MSDDYTPSLDEVRGLYIAHNFRECFEKPGPTQSKEEWGAEWDRMMAAHDEAVRAEEREKAAANLRWLADARAEYDHEATQREAHAARLLADIIDGQNDASGWLPSWRWDEWAARIGGQGEGR
ncbi:hypothetical protein QWJ90_01395 [Microbacterium oryzae]|uniref:hypothetical protein n=1 Tax=Microbacterium oryzae TaxID=743009 RepID=UPI0025B03429|nr:hypothetical protein [Microbacterium oryzae]MDN3309577.1 hypothetical protein [Microbacterium oryzae]